MPRRTHSPSTRERPMGRRDSVRWNQNYPVHRPPVRMAPNPDPCDHQAHHLGFGLAVEVCCPRCGERVT